MKGRRVQYGFCSFMPPADFCFQANASIEKHPESGCTNPQPASGKSLCLTLFRARYDPNVPAFSECSEDMRPGAFPDTLMLNTTGCCNGFDPLNYLRTTDAALKTNLNGYRVDFYEKDKIGCFRAARSQCAFQTNFKLFRLSYAWKTNGMLVSTSLLTADSVAENGWDALRSFVESVRFV